MIGKVEAIGKGGRGIVFYEGKPVFLDGVLKGEIVEFVISERRHSVSFGSLQKVIEPANGRVTPPCPYYGMCGGCNLQHAAYREQIAIKEDILRSNLKRIAKIEYQNPVEAITSPPFRYRTKIVLKVKDGNIGFFQKESHEIVEIESCLLMPQIVENFLPELRNNSIIKNLDQGEILILSSGSELSALLKKDRTGKYLSDKKTIPFKIANFCYHFSAENFIQANLFTLESMIDLVREKLVKNYFEKAVDLFCGVGFFTLVLSEKTRKVTAVEADEINVRSLKTNLENNKIENVAIRKANILKSAVPAADFYLIDPPRNGLNREIVVDITEYSPKTILYFSCDSATFSRDISYFHEAGYTMKELKIIDNFPQTDHFEIFSCLS